MLLQQPSHQAKNAVRCTMLAALLLTLLLPACGRTLASALLDGEAEPCPDRAVPGEAGSEPPQLEAPSQDRVAENARAR